MVESLLRAYPSKDGDAELRGYRGSPPRPPGRQRMTCWRSFLLLLAPAVEETMPFTYKLARRLALLYAFGTLLSCNLERRTGLTPVHPLDHITVSPDNLTLSPYQAVDLAAVGISVVGDTNNLPLRWTLTGGGLTDTFTVDRVHYGRYKALAVGDYLVIVSTLAGTPSDTATVLVRDLAVDTVIIAPPDTAALFIGTQLQLTATALDSSGNIISGRSTTWASVDPTIATVNSSGLVTAVIDGTAMITATTGGKQGNGHIKVSKIPVASVTVSPGTASLAIAQTTNLTATARDSAGNPLPGRVMTWTSNDASVATLTGNGRVTAIGPGAATITATSESKSGTAAITVTQPPVATVTVTPDSATIRVTNTVQLTATPRDSLGTPLSGRVVTWSSNAPGVAAVNGSGLVTGVAAGSATITATSEGKTGTSAIRVTLVPVASVTVTPSAATIVGTGTVQLVTTPKDSAGNPLTGRVVTWASNAPGAATVNGSGLVTGVSVGIATITATSEGKNGISTITVTAPPPPPPPPPPAVGMCTDTVAPGVPSPLRTFYVDGASGNDAADGLTAATAWRTLDKANSTARAGDLFLVSGTFTNQLIHPAQSGTATAKIVYRAKPGASAVISGGQYQVIAWLDGLSHIVVDGFELTNEYEAVDVRYGANNIWLRNLYIHDAGYGIHLVQASDNRIEDSRLERSGSELANSGEGIFIQDGSNRNHIVRNTISYAGHGALWISFQNAAEATSDDNVIERNDFSNPWASGMGLSGKAQRTTVQCNKLHDTANGSGPNYARSNIEVDGIANIIRYNEIFRGGAQGITLQGRTFNSFTQNSVGNQVYQNTFWQNGAESVQLLEKDVGNVQNNIIENNIFWHDAGFSYGSVYAITSDLYHSSNPWPNATANGNIVRNNIVPTGQQMMLVIRTTANESYSLAQAQATLAGWANNLQVDPLFVNESIGDVRLQNTSPAIDAGIIISGVPYLGLFPDLGAHELR